MSIVVTILGHPGARVRTHTCICVISYERAHSKWS